MATYKTFELTNGYTVEGLKAVIGDAKPAAAGLVKQSANVAYAAGANPTAAEFKALIDALVAAGIMAAASED